MDNDSRLDEKLAKMTDAILNDQPFDDADDEGYRRVIVALQQTIQPSQRPPEPFETRLQEAINTEWSRRPRRRSTMTPTMRYLAVAAAVALLVVGILIIGLPPNSSLPVTAGGDSLTPEALVILLGGVGIAAVAGIIYWRSRR